MVAHLAHTQDRLAVATWTGVLLSGETRLVLVVRFMNIGRRCAAVLQVRRVMRPAGASLIVDAYDSVQPDEQTDVCWVAGQLS